MKIFISGLSFRVNDDDLKQLFEEYGEIRSAKVITDRDTGRSRGFGFVEMTNDEDAQKAIEDLNKAEYDGKVIEVPVARPKTESRGPSSYGGGGGGGRPKRW